MADHRVDLHDACRFRAAGALARHIRRVHEVSADYLDRRTLRVADHGADIRAYARFPVRQDRRYDHRDET